MKFPDTSINGLALLVAAAFFTGVAGTVLQSVFGTPTGRWAQFFISATALVVGFGVVYGGIAVRTAMRQKRAE